MSKPDDSNIHRQDDVDRDNPGLKELRDRVGAPRLDNRGLFKHRPVVIRAFWPHQGELGTGPLTANDGHINLSMLRWV